MNIVVLISGNGTNLQALIDAQQTFGWGQVLKAVISDRPDAYGLSRAKDADIPAHSIDYQRCSSKNYFEKNLLAITAIYKPDLMVLAGFMRILSSEFINSSTIPILNLHPSLLPKFPGLNTHQQVLDAAEKEHGATVHLVTEQLDAGPIILQKKFSVMPEDTIVTLKQKTQQLEHQILPQAVNWFINKNPIFSDYL